MKYQAIENRNAGNSYNTVWKPTNISSRVWCVLFENGMYMRDKKKRVRRFLTKKSALKAASNMYR